MANGPLGGFMPTPPAQGQPPQVSLNTNAESRGKFNSFLGTLPKNGATTPLQTGVGLSSPMPVSPMTDNVNIFQPQMSQMAPMPMPAPMSMPMMPMTPSGRPVQNFFSGGEIDSFVDDQDSSNNFSSGNDNNDNYESFVGDDPDFSYNPDTGGFDVADRPDVSDNEQQQNIQDSQTFIDTPFSAPSVIDTRGRTNIRNVGARSNLRYDPQFTANLLQQRGLDPQGFMAPSDFSQTTQGGGSVAAPTLSSGLPSFGTGTDFLRERELAKLRPQAGLGVSPVDVNPLSIPLAPTTGDFYGDLLDDPLGLGFNTAGLIDSNRAAQQMRSPENFQQIASLNKVVPGAGGTLPDADPLATDVLGAIRSGAAGLPFTNNPGALKQGQEDLTTEVVKSLPASGSITPDNLAPAIFNTLDSGIDAIDRQLSLYARNNINTPESLANTYLGSGDKENSPANRAGYIDAIKGVAGKSFNLGNPATRDAIKNVIVNQEFGQAGRNVMADMRRGTDASILDGLNLQQLGANLPVTSDVNQLGSLDPIAQTAQSGIPIGEQRTGSRGDIVTPDAPFGAAPTTPGRLQAEFGSTLGAGILTPEEVGRATRRGQRDTEDFVSAMRMPGLAAPLSQFTNIAPPPVPVVPQDMQDIITQDENLARIEREQQAIQDARNTGRPQFNLGPGQRGVDLQQSSPSFARGMANIASVTPEFDLETMRGRRDRLPDQVFDIPTNFGVIDRNPDLDATRSFIGTNIDPEAYTGPNKGLSNIDMLGGRRNPTPDTGEPVADLTLDDARAMGDINQERVSDILNRPNEFKETFKLGDVEFPNLLATLANKAGSFFNRRLFDGIVSKGLDAVVDPDTGRIIGAKDEFGNLIEGRDLEQFDAGDDNEDPVKKFLKKATEDKEEEEDKPPNVIGGTDVRSRDPVPTVVKSKFPASTASFSPVGFDSGSLNDLIARITGVASPRKLQDGGVISSVDNFLTKVA